VDQAELLRHVLAVLESQDVTYALVGSYASAVYGEPRFTHDIDIVVHLTADAANRLCAAFPAPEFYVSQAAAREAVAMHGQFNVIHPASGNKIDFMIPRNDAWGRTQLTRRIRRPILPNRDGFVAAPEDVILGKLWYYDEGGSEKHLRDIAAMLQTSGDSIDMKYIDQWAQQLGYVEHWSMIVDRVAATTPPSRSQTGPRRPAP
jgi:hypothetical protein